MLRNGVNPPAKGSCPNLRRSMHVRLSVLTHVGLLLGIFTLVGIITDTKMKYGVTSQVQSIFFERETGIATGKTVTVANGRKHQELKKSSTSNTRILYPLNIDMQDVIRRIDSNKPVIVSPINSHDFKYVHNPSFRCEMEDGTYPFVVLLVKSACGNFQKRETIRQTWGNVTEYNNTVQLVFLLGHSSKHREQVAEEYNNFTDIVSEDYVDAYTNLTYKTIMGFRWAVKFCYKSKFFLFVDDDYFVNVKNLFKFLRSTNDSNLYTGNVWWKAWPKRSGKWLVSKEDYPGNHYPPYVAGGAYITSYHVARMFSIVFPYIEYLGMEDVYIGMVAYKVNVKPTFNAQILTQGDKSCWKKIQDILACHTDGLKIPKKKP